MGRITVTTLELVAAAYLVHMAAGVLVGAPAFEPLFQSGVLVGAGLILASTGRPWTERRRAPSERSGDAPSSCRSFGEIPGHRTYVRMEPAERLGRNLAAERKAAGITQEELAFRASVHRTLIGLIERGARNPRADTLVKLAGALGVQPAALCEGISWDPGVTGGFRVLDED